MDPIELEVKTQKKKYPRLLAQRPTISRSIGLFAFVFVFKLPFFSFQSIDLHALTGWIPERTSIKQNSPTFNESMHFDRLLNGVRKGNKLQDTCISDRDHQHLVCPSTRTQV